MVAAVSALSNSKVWDRSGVWHGNRNLEGRHIHASMAGRIRFDQKLG